jgi:hypothetical protein
VGVIIANSKISKSGSGFAENGWVRKKKCRNNIALFKIRSEAAGTLNSELARFSM